MSTTETMLPPASSTAASDFEHKSTLTSKADDTIAVLLTLTIVLTVFGNAVVLCLTWKRRKNLKPMDFMIANLAITDLGVAFLGYPFSASAAYHHKWNSGRVGCQFYGFVGLYFSTVSITSMTYLALFRYIKVCRNDVASKLTKEKTLLAIVMIWVYSLVWSVVPLLGWNSYVPEPFGLSCTVNWNGDSLADVSYMVCLFLFVFFLPIVVVLFSYASIGLKIWLHQRAINNRGSLARRGSATRNQVGARLTKIALAITVCFLISWSPYAIQSLMVVVCGANSVPVSVSAASAMFAKVSSLYNPVIYYIFNKKFRDNANALICCCGCIFLQKTFNYNTNVVVGDPQELPNKRMVLRVRTTCTSNSITAAKNRDLASGSPSKKRVVCADLPSTLLYSREIESSSPSSEMKRVPVDRPLAALNQPTTDIWHATRVVVKTPEQIAMAVETELSTSLYDKEEPAAWESHDPCYVGKDSQNRVFTARKKNSASHSSKVVEKIELESVESIHHQ